MAYYLLFTDVHLDDTPDNEYRWNIFEHVRTALAQYDVAHMFCLGDLVDRRDKFSSAFVNRLLVQLRGIAGRAPLSILRGNHDTTLRPPNYFEWLNTFSEGTDVMYVNRPTVHDGRLLLLPFTHHPRTAWSGHRLADYQAVFMHQTVPGSVVENGQVMENSDFPLLPGRVKFYSGDVHVPQRVRNVTYVGAPHPIRFGDDYPCRMLLLDEGFDVAMEVPLTGPRKRIIRITDVADLEGLDLRHGDQVKIECTLSADRVDRWSLDEERLAAWAGRLGVHVAGISTVLESRVHEDVDADPEQSPEALLAQFAAREGVSDDLLATGLRLLREVK